MAGTGSSGATIPVFDIGQVLLRWEPRAALARITGSEAGADAFMQEVDFASWHGRQDAGRLVAEAVAEHSARFPHYAEVFAAFYDRWLDAVPGEVPGTRVIFEALRARGPVYGISNFSRELFDRTVPAHPFLGEFTGLVLSADVGINKPDPRIYRILCERHGLDPRTCVFIDDSARNVEAARAAGMRGIVFTDAGALSSELAAMGFATTV
ncbi:MAG: HAD family phosphatase [Phreatobacter sp.]|uniref:HAD family hydrolase n=1 Tax=Phreatobacter sp. TaxID=1966341 RepID=UPI001A3DAD74|nr:HAD family phosphatase [Phreatobacter sp.]MBL8570340.1 HAD family phosphatase [Phreatobacter sp.]